MKMRQIIAIMTTLTETLQAETPDGADGDWQEALWSADTADEVRQTLAAAGATEVTFEGGAEPIYRLDDYVIEWDGTSAYTNIEGVMQWLSDADVAAYYPDYEQRWNDEFWQHPSPLYHATTEQNVKNIRKHGLNANNLTRGLSNRSIGAAVFTTSDYEETIAGSYGSVVFEIDTTRLATSPHRPYASQEPDVVAYELRNALAHAIGVPDYEAEIEGGISPATVVLYGHVPADYLSIVGQLPPAKAGGLKGII